MLPESINGLWLRFKALFRRRQLDRDLEDELQFHLAMREQKLAESGMPPEEAPHAARRQFGNATQAKEVNRELWTFPLLGSLWQDVRYGARSLGHNRGSAAAIVLLLALGIGGATALFGPLYSLVLSPLPYPHSDRLVRIGGNIPLFDGYFSEFVHPERLEPLFSAVAAYTTSRNPLQVGAHSIEASVATVTSGFFATLGVHPWLGSFPAAKNSGSSARGVVVSYRFWKAHLNGDKGILGRPIQSDTGGLALPPVVTGVMPPGFDFPPGADIWIPDPAGSGWLGMGTTELLGRLRPGLSLDQAAARLKGLGYKHVGPSDGRIGGPGPVLQTLHDYLLGDRKPLLWTLWSVSLLFLLLACAGAANLLLARGVQRQSEMVVRLTLGAGRARLIRQLLVETLLLASVGGLVGLGIAAAGARWIGLLLPAARGASSVSFASLGLLVLLAVAAAILCGLSPAFHATGGDLNSFLKTGTSGITRSMPRRRLLGSHELLAGSQLVVAMVLLIATGLLVRSLVARLSIPLGFNPRNIAVVETDLPVYSPRFNLPGGQTGRYSYGSGSKSPAAVQAAMRVVEEAQQAHYQSFFRSATEQLARLPGVASVGILIPPPFDPERNFLTLPDKIFLRAIRIVPNSYGGEIVGNGPKAVGFSRTVGPGAFRLLGIRLLAGREFTTSDIQNLINTFGGPGGRLNPDAVGNVIINEELAKRFWPSQDSVGKRFWSPEIFPNWCRVIGVVSNVRENADRLGAVPTAYIPFVGGGDVPLAGGGPGESFFLVKLRPGTALPKFAASARSALTSLEPDMPPPAVTSLQSSTTASLANLRLALALLGGFSMLGIVVAALGVYAAATLMAAARTREMGIRIALGAHADQIRGLAVWRSVRLALIALPLGALCAWGLARSLSHWLFQVGAADPATYATSIALLAVITLVAGLVPARRAARVDPVVALRQE